MCEHQPPHLVCGLLFLLSELLRARPDLGSLTAVLKQESDTDLTKFAEESDEEEEHYADAPDESKSETKEEDLAMETTDEKADLDLKPGVADKVAPGWTFKTQAGSREARQSYDPSCRNPLYSGAERSALWELQCLSQHFHPSVALFAQNLLDSQPIKYSGDPLSDFTLARFLDRFVFRNPKKNPEKNKPSTVLGKRNVYKPVGIKAIAPDSKDFLNRDVENVPTDERYIFKYFQDKLERKGSKESDETNSVTSDEFNDYLDKLGGRSNDFDDEDLDFAGGVNEGELEESDAEEEDEEPQVTAGNEDSDDEPVGLDGEDDENFKDLSSDDDDGIVNFGETDPMDEDDFDEEGFGESDMDEDVPMTAAAAAKKIGGKKSKTKFPKFDPTDLSSVLADAEQFSHLFEDNEDAGLASSVSNKDKASKKQLGWERDRDNEINSSKWKSGKKGKVGGGTKRLSKNFKKSYIPKKHGKVKS